MNFEKLETNAAFYVLVSLSLPKVQNSSKSTESLYALTISQMGPNSSEHWNVGMHVFISIENPNLWSNFNSKNLVKSETPSFDFTKVCLKEGKIALNITKFFMHSYLTRNPTKICVHAYLPNAYIDAFAKVALKGSENSSERWKWRVCLFIEMGT